MRAAGVPAGRIYSVADIAQDPHYQARGAIARLRAASGIDVDMPAVFPCLSDNPGAIRERARCWASTPTPCWRRPASTTRRAPACAPVE